MVDVDFERRLWQKQQIEQILQTECDRHRNNPDAMGTDILSLLLEARYEDGQPMSERWRNKRRTNDNAVCRT